MDPRKLQSFPWKPRVFILSDISNEPDDAESLVRYLLYANQFHTEGLVATTSTWMRTQVCPQDMRTIIDAYAGAVDNLNRHAHPDSQYPPADYFHNIISSGNPVYGFQAVGADIALSEGAQKLLKSIITPSERPLWILVWGEAAALRARLRVYAISDQDDTGVWIRNTFPDIFYIASVHAWNQYGMAAWTGISGDKLYGFDQGGPDYTKVSEEWIKENIQIGPLGSAYPDYMYIPEGDTPTFLYLIQNGLGIPEKPDYGSWGGRYQLTNDSRSGLYSRHYSDCADIVVGQDGKTYQSNHATIWRWRDAYQNDFATRIHWTLSPSLLAANHHPVISLNGVFGSEPLYISAEAGSMIELDATGTYDPDGDAITSNWWHYRDPSATQWRMLREVEEINITSASDDSHKVTITLPKPESCCVEPAGRSLVEKAQALHVVLEVTASGAPSLTSYRRVVIQATYKA